MSGELELPVELASFELFVGRCFCLISARPLKTLERTCLGQPTQVSRRKRTLKIPENPGCLLLRFLPGSLGPAGGFGAGFPLNRHSKGGRQLSGSPEVKAEISTAGKQRS